MFNKRLSKARKKALDIPVLPKGYYWVLRATNTEWNEQVLIRKRRCYGWKGVVRTSTYGVSPPGNQASRNDYQRCITNLHRDFMIRYNEKRAKADSWKAWSGAPASIEDEVRKALSNG